LEQNKARAALVSDKFDDESLEQVFQEVASVDNPKKAKTKKTREELLRELKEKRSSGHNETGEGEQTLVPEEETRKLEMAKQQGKFKPIGFKPIGQPAAEPKKKKKAKADGIDGERKKKKRKLDSRQGVVEEQPSKPEATVQPAAPPSPPEPEREPIEEDFDIFAGAGDYDGLELGDDDDEDDAKPERKGATVEDEEEEDPSTSTRPKQWISIEEDGAILRPKSPEPPQSASPPPEPSSSKVASRDHEEEDGEMDEDVPMKLVPLASSALPSVRDFLDMDRAATSSRKNKKRKDKKKPTQDPDSQTANAEAKAERDYKRYFIFCS
jgi:IK cytokine